MAPPPKKPRRPRDQFRLTTISPKLVPRFSRLIDCPFFSRLTFERLSGFAGAGAGAGAGADGIAAGGGGEGDAVGGGADGASSSATSIPKERASGPRPPLKPCPT